jgi:predicted unusual protein kinase regulating ubiquinone biosynthesis (AarF/ABC1/UbiB family)
MWWNDKIYVLDLGMVGEVDAELRRSLLLLLLAFWQEDTAFLADLMLSLTEQQPAPEFDHAAYRDELAALVAKYRHLPLNELRLGPLIQQLTEISVRHSVRLPASLALIGKAFGQMQLAAAELDPTLDPFSVASRFYMRQLAGQLCSSANPRKMLYETQKLRVRLEAMVQGFERIAGTRPGERLRVDFGGHEALRDSISLGGRRVAVGLAAAASVVATAVVATARNAPAWATPTFGAASAILSGGLVIDVLRRR